ncbi:MAG: Ig-like domain-containing protein, partial [Ketobacteraceae bacterium]|nr:Ig-like domain-containing protein [Ketobacteraceae bacterium]
MLLIAVFAGAGKALAEGGNSEGSGNPGSIETVAPALTLEEINNALEDALHTLKEIGNLIRDFAQLIKKEPLKGFLALLEFIAEKLGLLDSGDGIDGPLPIPGPGLGNLSYGPDELFQPVGWINHDNGLPGIYSGRKPFGTNLGMMIDGYFFTLFAPDSGKGPGGFLIYDLSDPHKPKLMKRLYEPEGRTAGFREPHAFGLARIGDRRFMAFQSTSGVEFWDFTDLNALERVGEIDLPGVNGGDYSSVAWQLAWQAPYLYVASSEQGIFIVDAGDPSNPVLAERDGPNPVPVSELGGFRVGPIFTFGNRMVISSMQTLDGMASLDISDPVNPRLLTRVPDLAQLYYAICFNGEQVAVSVRGADARMVLYDLSDPADFVLTDNDLAVPGQLYCAFQDHYVFQGTEDRVHKIDIRDPFNPVDIGSGTISGPLVRLVDHGQVSPLGNLVFVGNDHGTGSAFMPHDPAPDHTPPEVVVTAPGNGAEGVHPLTGIGISFSDVPDFSSVNSDSIAVTDASGVPVVGTFSLQNGIVNFVPQRPLQPFTEYQVRVVAGGVTDVMGNALNQPYSFRFSTGASDQLLDVEVEIPEQVSAPASPGEILQFDAIPGEPLPGATYSWQFGDGTSVSGLAEAAVEHQYQSPGHYPVTLIISYNGKTRQVTFTKTVVPEPTDQAPLKTSTLVQNSQHIYAVNPDNDTLTAIDKQGLAVLWEVEVGDDPQTVSLDLDGNLWVAARGDDQLVQVNPEGDILQSISLPYGAVPYAVACASGAPLCWATLSGTGQLIQFDPAGNIEQTLALTDPRAVAVSGDNTTVWVTRLISPDEGAQVYQVAASGVQGGGALVLNDTLLLAPDITTTDSQDRARGLTNYLFDIAISPSGNEVMIPGKKDNIFRGLYRDGQPLEHDKTVRAVTQRIAVTSGASTEWDFDNRANARAVAYSPLGDYAFIALQGSNKVAVMDVFSGSQRLEIETALAPQGLAIDPERGLLFVHNFMSRSLQVFDIAAVLSSSGFDAPLLATLPLVAQETLPPPILAGKQIFYNADDPRMSRESYFSCASCHVDGGHDGRVWDFTDRGEGLRNTITLKGRAGLGHGNLHWTANFDEIQDFENDIRNGFGGTGFLTDEEFQQTRDPLGDAKAGLSEELDNLAAYVSSLLSVTKSPYKQAATEISDAAQRGQQLFHELDCSQCHAGSGFTDGTRHPLVTWAPGSGQAMGQPLQDVGIETPTLLGLWETAPYFHQGQAANLMDVINHPGHGNGDTLPVSQQQDLVAYLLTLDGRGNALHQQHHGFVIRNGRGGCLAAEEPVSRAQVLLRPCDSAPRWWLDDHQRIHLAEQPELCVSHNGRALYWSRVRLSRCGDDSRQQFQWHEDGHIHWQGNRLFVLDRFGTGPVGRVGSWWRHGGANQIWERQ